MCAIYREGYHIVKQIETLTKQVFSDAADAGAPVQKSDALWNGINQLREWYGVEGSAKILSTKETGSFEFELMDEWAVSDRRKTEKEALERYRLTYTKLESYQKKPYLNPQFKGKHGFAYVEKIK